MILLEFQNRVIREALTSRLSSKEEKVKAIDMTVADFDGVLYHITNPGDGEVRDESKIIVSISLNFYHQLTEHGVEDILAREYGDLLIEPENGYNVSLLLDIPKLAADTWEPVVTKVAMLKRNCFASVFEKYFALQKAGGGGVDGKPAIVQYRPQETMYVSAHKDRVTAVFSVLFSDDDDVILGKVFLTEFKDARKNQQQAPQVLFSLKDPPRELEGQAGALTGDNVGYVTFVLFPRHFKDEQSASNSIDLIHTFRDYLHYHLKCSKAYLHSRMRAQTSSLLKILNRAKPESETKERKTFTGKSFVRK